jgi:hypothetical protein
MRPNRPELTLDAEQEAEALRIYERLREVFDEEAKAVARMMASKANGQLFGQTEFELRDQVHRLGAKALEVVADERQKKGGIRRS